MFAVFSLLFSSAFRAIVMPPCRCAASAGFRSSPSAPSPGVRPPRPCSAASYALHSSDAVRCQVRECPQPVTGHQKLDPLSRVSHPEESSSPLHSALLRVIAAGSGPAQHDLVCAASWLRRERFVLDVAAELLFASIERVGTADGACTDLRLQHPDLAFAIDCPRERIVGLPQAGGSMPAGDYQLRAELALRYYAAQQRWGLIVASAELLPARDATTPLQTFAGRVG